MNCLITKVKCNRLKRSANLTFTITRVRLKIDPLVTYWQKTQEPTTKIQESILSIVFENLHFHLPQLHATLHFFIDWNVFQAFLGSENIMTSLNHLIGHECGI